MNRARAITGGVMLMAMATAASGATFTIRSIDGTGEGLDDATPFTPVGGNNATTLGQARMNVLVEAARIWGELLQSNVPILVDVSFDPLTCSATSGTLGSAGPRAVFRNIGGGASADIFYVSALADAISGSNRSADPASSDINARFNSSLDSDPGCLGGRGFYYGLDHNRGISSDLLLVALHELGHGLGFTAQVDLTTGEGFIGGDSVERFESYTHRIFDEQLGSLWPALSAAQRVQSATRTGSLAWSGTNVNSQIGRFTQGVTANGRVRLYAPATVSSGSSVSHWDTVVTPNILMEPNITSTLTTSSTDITVCALQDIGWTVTTCPHYATNRAPTATAQTVTAVEDTPLTITLTGSDSDNDQLTFTVVAMPGRGTLSAISTPAPHTVVYTPNANANGADSFTFAVNDGAVTSAAALVSITITPVNDVPTASDASITAVTGQSTSIPLPATDNDGDALTYIIVSTPQNGTLSGSGAIVSYQSTNGYLGTDSFTYRVNDGTVNSSVATVSIAVQSPPPPPPPASTSSSGGGGAVTYLWTLLISLLAVGRIYLQRDNAQRRLAAHR